jgi:hypothetical protein
MIFSEIYHRNPERKHQQQLIACVFSVYCEHGAAVFTIPLPHP